MKRMTPYLLILLFSVLFLISTLPASAAEMVTIKNVDKKDVANQIMAASLKTGMTIKSASEYNIVLEDNKQKPLKFYLNWGSGAKVVHTFNFVQTGPDLLLSCENKIISYPGTYKEQTHIASADTINGYFPSYREDIAYLAQTSQNDIRALKGYFNGLYLYGIDYELNHKQLTVTNIRPDFPANKAGIIVGDKIVKVNGTEVKGLDKITIDGMFAYGEEGAEIEVTVVRNEKEIPLRMVKQFYPAQFTKG